MESSDALLATLLYSDLFHFPLTKEELAKRCIGRRVSDGDIEAFLQTNRAKQVGQYMGISSSSVAGHERTERKKFSKEKYQLALHVAHTLSLIPTLLFIGISGSVAAENASHTDDIDLFLITIPGTLWITRLLVLSVGELLGVRGKKPDQPMFCMNIFVASDHLTIPPIRRDIYTAYELLQLTPLFQKNDTYHELIRANSWAKMFLPNLTEKSVPLKRSRGVGVGLALRLFDNLARSIQVRHLNRINAEHTYREGVLSFHTGDTRGHILASFRRKLTTYHLDKAVAFLYTRKSL